MDVARKGKSKMSNSSCPASKASAGVPICPVSGQRGTPVEWLTVSALIAGPLPPRQRFWLCRDPNCEVVYYGEKGTILKISDLRVHPGFKTKNKEGILCYCFQLRRCDVQAELERSGRTNIIARITSEVKAGNCACEVRNPSGKCCLGEVRAEVEEIHRVSCARGHETQNQGRREEACALPTRN